jgi:hypothetical protein
MPAGDVAHGLERRAPMQSTNRIQSWWWADARQIRHATVRA